MLAFFIYSIVQSIKGKPYHCWWQWLPLIIAFIGHLLWIVLHPSIPSEHHYLSTGESIFRKLQETENLFLEIYHMIQPQLIAFYKAWLSAWLMYWQEGEVLRPWLVNSMGISALAVLIVRIWNNQLEAWYIMIYIAIIIIWPFPGQMMRFIYPIMPFLLLYSIYGIYTFLYKINNNKTHFLSLALMLGLFIIVLPSSIFIYLRFQVVSEGEIDYIHSTEFYHIPDLAQAKQIAESNLRLLKDIQLIQETTEEDAHILWFTPNVIQLLAQRPSSPIPNARNTIHFIEKIANTQANYIFLSRLHPRNTKDQVNGLVLIDIIEPITDTIWYSLNHDGKSLNAVLLKINPLKLTYYLKTMHQ